MRGMGVIYNILCFLVVKLTVLLVISMIYNHVNTCMIAMDNQPPFLSELIAAQRGYEVINVCRGFSVYGNFMQP